MADAEPEQPLCSKGDSSSSIPVVPITKRAFLVREGSELLRRHTFALGDKFKRPQDREAPDGAPSSRESPATGILVHGCHLMADGWEHIVWGDPPAELGRLPHAVLLAWEERAQVVVLGTGASEKDGLKESQYTEHFLWKNWSRLSEFDALRHVPLDEAEALLRSAVVLDTETKNTDQEVRAALGTFSRNNCLRAVLVSSPTHLPRCLASACKVSEEDPGLYDGAIYASPAGTCYEGRSAADVVVVEPPHRGDRDKSLDDLPFHEMVARVFKVKPEQKREFLHEFNELLERYNA